MTGTTPRWTMPIRRWLALALLLCFAIPFAVTGVLVFHFAGVGDEFYETDEAIETLRGQQSQWADPEWQASTRKKLTDEGIDFVLFDDGEELLRTTDDPFTSASGGSQARLVEQFGDPESGSMAIVYGEDTAGPPDGVWLAPIVALSALLLTLSGIGWLLGRTVVGPLDATSGAARQIATGDLDVSLPRSQVREVSEVSSALELMSQELQASLNQQAELEQERRMFVGAIAHDLRTPLFSLRGALEGLTSGVANTPEKRERYTVIAREKADALERLISDLFAYTRLEYLDQMPIREPLDLHNLVGHLVEGFQPQAEAKGVELRTDIPKDGCTVQADRHMVMRAMENILDNAVRFTPSGGTIKITCAMTNDAVSVSILDSGPGIPRADLPHLFSPLYRGETSRNRSTGGAGLGLTIARSIIRAHGGDLTAENQTNGAMFTATLPRGSG